MSAALTEVHNHLRVSTNGLTVEEIAYRTGYTPQRSADLLTCLRNLQLARATERQRKTGLFPSTVWEAM